ncbi:virulence RhuM family protein [Xanthomonas nasturtii]|uniref:virulence RhuM family protein n=1 Tax=Xanthomonas nasturtii TaxID=1843581 RepID=UPI0020121F2F|nr:RhuM family protein [Xanthomonas nasturtii]MCL1525556.1 virulence RhuM family protein [Xanthomonas nasturtii]MCL1534378.1 virulence RhuM family protein [Xanthomonas nasturtii]MCL1542893.1 virulence RhuM family protein [Xanthomonas nasturtii]
MSKAPKPSTLTTAAAEPVDLEAPASVEGQGEFVLYTTADGLTRVEMRAEGGSLWLSQAEIATLFQSTPQNVTQHVKAIYAEGEADPEATCKSGLQVRQEGGRVVRRNVRFYSLEIILAVGYRARSARGTQFRQWATAHLSEYLLKGFVLDDERLKNPPVGDSVLPDRFGELLERIRDIRASERRMYLRVREIFALAADYAPTLPETTTFFRIIQNKLHYAVSGQTAAEIIRQRADHTKHNMGLTSTRKERVQKADVSVAKNYLAEAEITELNRIITMWLDFAEDQATRRKEVFLKDWAEKLDAFLSFNDRQVLVGAGKVSHKQAVAHAQSEYEQFAAQRRAALEAEGKAYTVRMLGAGSADHSTLSELSKVAKRLTKKKGG